LVEKIEALQQTLAEPWPLNQNKAFSIENIAMLWLCHFRIEKHHHFINISLTFNSFWSKNVYLTGAVTWCSIDELLQVFFANFMYAFILFLWTSINIYISSNMTRRMAYLIHVTIIRNIFPRISNIYPHYFLLRKLMIWSYFIHCLSTKETCGILNISLNSISKNYSNNMFTFTHPNFDLL
jgi:hypothetical protein